MTFADLGTPCLILDRSKLTANVRRMAERSESLGVPLRPHLKTAKCIEVANLVTQGQPGGITVSTLSEAEFFFSNGINDILYAVGLAPGRLPQVRNLIRRGAQLSVLIDNPDVADVIGRADAANEVEIPVLIEIDCDGHRAGVRPDEPALLDIANRLANGKGSRLAGVLTHAGAAYDCRDTDSIRRMAEQERQAVVDAGSRLRTSGHEAPVISLGSTPTAIFAEQLTGVTELRPGTYVFQDLVMTGLGVCTADDCALSVLTTVIGHQKERNCLIIDAGWMALSRDRGTATQQRDFGYGQICLSNGSVVDDVLVTDANQEHGIVAQSNGKSLDLNEYPIGTLLRILPNHACATAAQHDNYSVVERSDLVIANWQRCHGW